MEPAGQILLPDGVGVWSGFRRAGPGQVLPLLCPWPQARLLPSGLNFLESKMGEQDRAIPEWTLVASQARPQLRVHTGALKTGGHCHQIPVLVSSGLPGGSDKFLSPRRWQPELFLEQLVVGEFPFGSGWGQESWAGEVPCRDRAGPSSSTSPGTERPPRSPEVLGPCEHLPFNPEPRPSRSSAEATLQGTGLCPASHCRDPLTLSSHLGLLSLSLRVCLASDRETGPRDPWGLDLGCLSAPTVPLTTRRVGAASGPGPSAWHGLCHCRGWRGSYWVIPDFPELPRLRGKWEKY